MASIGLAGSKRIIQIIAGIVLMGTILLLLVPKEVLSTGLQGLIVIGLLYLILLAIGIWAGTKNDNEHINDLLIAGRKMPLWIACLTMAATWLGGGYINGTAESVAEFGLVWLQAPWGYGLSLIIGGIFFAPIMRRHNFRTMLDPLEMRYGKKATAVFFVPAVLGEVFWIAAILIALGTTFSVITGVDTSLAIIVSASIAVIYTMIGGLWSVAYTDILQLALLAIGLGMVIPFLLPSVGGVSGLWESYEAKHSSMATLLPSRKALGDSYWYWWDIALLLIFGGIPWQVYFQRVASAKSENAAKYLSIFAGVICIIVAIPAGIIGMVGSVTEWSALGLPGPESGAHTLPYVYQYLSPNLVALVGLGAIAAAVMSSIDSSMLSASSLATMNVYKPLVKPKADSRTLLITLRRVIFIVGLAATLISLKMNSVYELWVLCSDFIYCLLFPALFCALFDQKSNRYGALAGFCIAFILRFGGGESALGIPQLIPYPVADDGTILLPFRTLAMLSGLMTSLVVSRLTARQLAPSKLYTLEE